MAEESSVIDLVKPSRTVKNKGSSLLFRDDFDSGPVSLDLIEENLWLGMILVLYKSRVMLFCVIMARGLCISGNLKAACDLPVLQSYNITHILTVDSVPLPRVITDQKHLTTKYVQGISQFL